MGDGGNRRHLIGGDVLDLRPHRAVDPYCVPTVLTKKNCLKPFLPGGDDYGVDFGGIDLRTPHSFRCCSGVQVRVEVSKERLESVVRLSRSTRVSGELQDLDPELKTAGQNGLKILWYVIDDHERGKGGLEDEVLQHVVQIAEVVVTRVFLAASPRV